MARGTTLGQLVVMFREEVGDATSAGLGQQSLPHIKRLLSRTQEFLWNDFAWPHLRLTAEKLMQAGERYYSFPAELDFLRIENVSVRWDDTWMPVEYGIEPGHYNSSDPELDTREDPVSRWQAYQDDQLEVWPLPATNGLRLRMEGIRKLDPLIDDADRAMLDDNLIVLFAATEMLGRRKAGDAKAKENLAQGLYRRLKAQQTTTKGGMIVMGGGHNPSHGPKSSRPYPRYGRRI